MTITEREYGSWHLVLCNQEFGLKFPALPETDDRRRSELLRLMGATRHPGVYVLGCLARYVTVYAQQVRALNLVDSLAKSGLLSLHSRVAVIGGGIAGLTAAAATAVRGAKYVQVFEETRRYDAAATGIRKTFPPSFHL